VVRFFAQKMRLVHATSRSEVYRNLIVEFSTSSPGHRGSWEIRESRESSSTWISVHRLRGRLPDQGWKLHVSATVRSAEAVLRRCLPLLLTENAAFKVAATPEVLGDLNNGAAGLSQVGKFITIYPSTDGRALRLAEELDRATRGLEGPAVSSDRRLTPDSIVYYRYGAFDGPTVQTALGEVLPGLRTPAGELVPDRHLPVYQQPVWVTDPFLKAGLSTATEPSQPLMAGRYLGISTVHRSARGTVELGVDLEGLRRCVLKTASQCAAMSEDGRDARDRLRYEAEVLSRLSPDPRIPEVFDLVEEGSETLLVMEDVEGETLMQRIERLAKSGCFLDHTQVVAWGLEIAEWLEMLHTKGLVYCDIKPTNILVPANGVLRWVDFELTYDQNQRTVLGGRGTPGYISPQRSAGLRPTPSDDIYAFGALLYFMATAAEPSQAPRPAALLDRPVNLLNPSIPPGLTSVIERCLNTNPLHRPDSMSELRAALSEGGTSAPSPTFGFGRILPERAIRVEEQAREMASRLGDVITQELVRECSREGNSRQNARRSQAAVGGDLHDGVSGTLLGLSELVAELDVPAHRAALVRRVRQLQRRAQGTHLAGLYVGGAGFGTALLHAGQVLGESHLIEAAKEQGNRIAAMPFTSPDIFHGTAGRLRFHLLLWDELADSQELQFAIEAGDRLLMEAERGDSGEMRWRIPNGFDGLSGHAYLGYAHGAAGIGDALLDLYEVVGEERFKAAARGVAAWLSRLAVPALDDGSGLNWPIEEDGPLPGAFWCHGATGIGTFFVHAYQVGGFEGALELARRAARTAAWGVRWSGPTLCHGLAGSIEFLLDVYQATGEEEYVTQAQSLARLLYAFDTASEHGNELSRHNAFTKGYTVGTAGVAACILRLGSPARLPRLLSRRGFRRREDNLVRRSSLGCGTL
jgi:tRNA A-37 threonylcarbamoyl transferase component Bud32